MRRRVRGRPQVRIGYAHRVSGREGAGPILRMVRPLIDGRDQGADRGVLQGHLNQGPPPVRGLREGGPSSSFPSSSRRSPAPSPPSSGAARGGRSSGRCWRWFSSGDGGGRDRCRANRIGQIERFSGDRRTCNHSHLRRRFLIYSSGRGRQVLFRYHAGVDQLGDMAPRFGEVPMVVAQQQQVVGLKPLIMGQTRANNVK